MTMTLPPLFAIIGSVIGYVGVQIAVEQGVLSFPPLVGAAVGGLLGLIVWHVSDAPMTNRGLVGNSDDR